MYKGDENKEYIDEFFLRFFPPEDKKLAELRNVPTEKNFIALIRIQLNKANKNHSGRAVYDEKNHIYEYITTRSGTLENELGWEYEDLVSFIYADILENIYFFDKKKNVALDTYVFLSINNAIQKLKNLTGLKDEKGARRESRKETKIIKKIQKAKWELESAGEIVNLEKVQEKIEGYNKKVTHTSSKIRKEDVEKYYDNTIHQKYDNMSFQDEMDSEKSNDLLMQEIWEKDQKDSSFDPRGNYVKKETASQIDGLLHKIISTDKEKLMLDFLLENLLQEKKKLKVEAKEFNSFYTDKLGFEALSQHEVDNVLESVISKIAINRNVFRKVTLVDF